MKKPTTKKAGTPVVKPTPEQLKKLKSVYKKHTKVVIIPKKETAKVPGKQAVNKVKVVNESGERIVKTLPATKGKWEIYAYHNSKAKKETTYKIGEKTFTGFFEYGNRLIKRNGRVVTGNKGFNTVRIATDNIGVVKTSA